MRRWVCLVIALSSACGREARDCAGASARVEALWTEEATAAGKSDLEMALDPGGTPESGAKAWARIVFERCERERWSGRVTSCVRGAPSVASANACMPQHE